MSWPQEDTVPARDDTPSHMDGKRWWAMITAQQYDRFLLLGICYHADQSWGHNGLIGSGVQWIYVEFGITSLQMQCCLHHRTSYAQSTIIPRKYTHCSVLDSDQTVNIGPFKHCGLHTVETKEMLCTLNKEH